jgi:drug/metabolite transporter (DMT)-like permease
MNSHRLKSKTIIFLVLMVLFGPTGDVLLGKGMRALGPVPGLQLSVLPHFLIRAFESGTVWLAISSLSVFFISYLLALSWADFSFVQPSTSLGYGMVAVLGYFALHESISPTRWLGVIVICLGVFLVGQTPARTTEPRIEPRNATRPAASPIAATPMSEIG